MYICLYCSAEHVGLVDVDSLLLELTSMISEIEDYFGPKLPTVATNSTAIQNKSAIDNQLPGKYICISFFNEL